MASLGDTDLKITTTYDGGGIDQAKSAFENIKEVALGIGLEQIFEKTTEAIKDLISETFNEASSLQFLKVNLDNLTGSAANTNKILAGTQDLIDKGLFKPTDIERYTQLLIQMGVPQQNVNQMLHDMAAASLGTSSGLQDASSKMEQMASLLGFVDDKGEIQISMLQRMERSMHIPILGQLKMDMEGVGGASEYIAKGTKMTADQMDNLKNKISDTQAQIKILSDEHVKAGVATEKHALSVKKATDQLNQYQEKLGKANTIVYQSNAVTDMSAKTFAKQTVSMQQVEKALHELSTGHGEFAKTIDSDSQTMEARQQALSERFASLGRAILGVSETGDVIKGGLFDKIENGLTALADLIDKHQKQIQEFGEIMIKVLSAITDFIVAKLIPAITNVIKWLQQHKEVMALLAGVVTGLVIVALIALIGSIVGVIMAIGTAIGAAVAFFGTFTGLAALIGGAVVAAFILVKMHIKELGDLFKTVGEDIVTIGKAIANAILDYMLSPFINFINTVIDGVNTVSKLAGHPTNVGHLSVPHLATGTDFFQGGMAVVGENGPELVNLPRGSQVIPNNQIGTAGGIVQYNYIYSQVDMDQAMRDLGWRLRR